MPDGAEFQADKTGPDDDQMFGTSGKDRASVLVPTSRHQFDAGQGRRLAAGCKDDVLCGELLFATVGRGDFHFASAGEAAVSECSA